MFNNVLRIGYYGNISIPFSQGKIIRLRSLLLSPYIRTLHLDTDTRVLTEDLSGLFSLLDLYDVAMVETSTDDSYCRAQLGRRMYNSGVQLFRKTTKTTLWLEAWLSTTERNFEAASQPFISDIPSVKHVPSQDIRRKLLNMDQISLVEILSPEVNRFALRFFRLDPSWNYRGSKLPDNNVQPARIFHLPALRRLTRVDILTVAFVWRRWGRSEAAESLYRYISSLHPEKGWLESISES